MEPLSNQLNSMQIDTTDNNEDFEDVVDGIQTSLVVLIASLCRLRSSGQRLWGG